MNLTVKVENNFPLPPFFNFLLGFKVSDLILSDVFETCVISCVVCDKCVADGTFLLGEVVRWRVENGFMAQA